jgi:Zn-dependent protease
MPTGQKIIGFGIILLGWMFSLCLHEFAHALVAYRGGDTSVRDKGYLTFNPARYTNRVDSLLWPLAFLLLGGIALPGGAVYVNRAALRSRGWDCAVSLAGPAANVLLLLVLVIPFHLALVDVTRPTIFWSAYAFVCHLQIMAALFNLVPIPPLDGFGAISAYMDPLARARAYAMSTFGFIVFLMVLWTDNPVSRAFWGAVLGISMHVGIPQHLVVLGVQMLPLVR